MNRIAFSLGRAIQARSRAAVFCAGLVLGIALPAAEPAKFDSLKVGRWTYYSVTILGTSETDLYFRHLSGIANVKLKYLSPELQKRFEYDPKAAEEAERRQLQEDAEFHETVLLDLNTRAQKAVKAAQQAAASNEDSVADPISSQSLLNKPAPKLEVEKWLGPAPDLQGKAVLVFFWTTWSVPCRKAISELNGYQGRFKDKLVVVGLASQPATEIEELTEPKIQFALATDSKSKLATAAGVTSVPCILFVDAKGVVRYQGHPAALDAAKLQKFFPAEAVP